MVSFKPSALREDKIIRRGIGSATGNATTRSAFPWFESYQALGELIGPGVDDWMAIDVVDAGHDALLEFVF